MGFPIGTGAVRAVRERTPTTVDHFDATAYGDKLIAGGIDPISAAQVAAKTAAARNKWLATTPSPQRKTTTTAASVSPSAAPKERKMLTKQPTPAA